MPKLFAVAVAAVALSVAGCNRSPEGGPAPGTPNSFTFDLPTSLAVPLMLTQGETKIEKITLNRGKDFKGKVEFSVTKKGDKIEAKFDKSTVNANDPAETNLTVTADKDAPVGEGEIEVTAKPETGPSSAKTFKIKVSAK